MSPAEIRTFEIEVAEKIADLALVPPKLNTNPLPKYDYDQLDYGMTIGIARTPGGRLWACWVAGEHGPKAFFVLNRSDGDGETWSKPCLVIGILYPPAFLWFSGRCVESAIALVMLGMGFTLTIGDFKRLLKIPGSFALGFACQYTIMPLLGWSIGRMLHLEAGFAAGLILVAACPGGVASNLISYLARANVALSVVLTMASTLTAFVMTPLWCKTLAGTYVEVDAWGICFSTLRAVVAPVLIGVFCNWKFPHLVAKASAYWRFRPLRQSPSSDMSDTSNPSDKQL